MESKEECYLGWERKRGLLNQFNEYILGNSKNTFKENTIEKVKERIPKIKYIITLDADTDLVLNSGYAGTWVYGFMERLLIPFGLHHVFYLPFWQTGVGGTMEVGGQLIERCSKYIFLHSLLILQLFIIQQMLQEQ